jgi:hypothetical protein
MLPPLTGSQSELPCDPERALPTPYLHLLSGQHLRYKVTSVSIHLVVVIDGNVREGSVSMMTGLLLGYSHKCVKFLQAGLHNLYSTSNPCGNSWQFFRKIMALNILNRIKMQNVTSPLLDSASRIYTKWNECVDRALGSGLNTTLHLICLHPTLE